MLDPLPRQTVEARVLPVDAIAVDLVSSLQPLASGEPGGGAPGSDADGLQAADEEPARSPMPGQPVAVRADNPRQQPKPAARAARRPAKEPSPGRPVAEEVVTSESDELEEAYSVAAAVSHPQRETLGVSLSPARATRLKAGARSRGPTRFGTARGSGRGEGGGRGGGGLGPAGGFPFGGEKGHFLAQVCFIPEGTPSLKSLGACRVETTFRTDHFNVPTRAFDRGFPGVSERSEWFAILYTGTFSVERAGVYEFALASDDGSILEIDDQVVVDNDGLHGSVVRRGTVELQPGTHRLRLRYFQGPRVMVALQLWVTPPGKPRRLMGPSI